MDETFVPENNPETSQPVETDGEMGEEQLASGFIAQAPRDLTMRQGGAMVIVAGRDLDLAFGGAQTIVVGKDAEINNGGSVFLTSQQVTGSNSFFGVVVTREANFQEGSRVLLNTRQAVAFGVAFGAVFALVGYLLRRR